MKDKEFTSHKAKYALQFGTNNNMIGLSQTFKSIKQKIQLSQHSELILFLMFWKAFFIFSSVLSLLQQKKKIFTQKNWSMRGDEHMSNSEEWFLVKILSFCLNLKVFPPCRCSKWFKTTYRSFYFSKMCLIYIDFQFSFLLPNHWLVFLEKIWRE